MDPDNNGFYIQRQRRGNCCRNENNGAEERRETTAPLMSAIVGRPSGKVFITWAHNQIQALSAVNYMTDDGKKCYGAGFSVSFLPTNWKLLGTFGGKHIPALHLHWRRGILIMSQLQTLTQGTVSDYSRFLSCHVQQVQWDCLLPIHSILLNKF